MSPSQPADAARPSRTLAGAAPCLLILVVVVALNSTPISPDSYDRTNDVQNINRALDAAPRFRDTLLWWTGSLSHDGIRDYRPLTSYLFWTYRQLFGKDYGKTLLAGFLIFIPLCWLQFCLVSRLVGPGSFRLPLALGAVVILANPPFWNSDPQPLEWLAWFPGHPVILCGLFAAVAVVAFDVWLEVQRPSLLLASMLATSAAMLTWGTAVVLPGMLALLAWQRRELPASRRQRVRAVVLSAAVVVLILALRAWFVPGARGPVMNTKWLLKEFMQVSGSFGLYLWGSRWPAYFVISILASCAVLPRVRAPLLAKLALAAAAGCTATALGGESPIILMATLFDPGPMNAVRTDMFYLTLWGWSALLLWRFRRREPVVAAYGMVVLINLPTAQYTGWHYRLLGLFFWGPVYALAWKCWLAWLHEQGGIISNQLSVISNPLRSRHP